MCSVREMAWAVCHSPAAEEQLARDLATDLLGTIRLLLGDSSLWLCEKSALLSRVGNP